MKAEILKNKIKEKNSGITLIALVITIIVLLILAGVSIATLTGQNGILTQANTASEQTEIATEKEQLSLAVTDVRANGFVLGENTLNDRNLQNSLNNIAGANKTSVTGSGILTVTFTDSQRSYYVTADGKVMDDLESQENVFTYTEDGYITGIKEEYLKDPETGNSTKYASIDSIKVAVNAPRYYLIDELNGILIIPNKIGDTDIIGIAEGALSRILNVEQIIISDGITELKSEAIRNCDKLENIVLPNTLIKIESWNFAYLYSLKNITIPESVMEIGEQTFWECNNLKTITIKGVEGRISGEPWGAPDTTEIVYLNEDYTNFLQSYLSNKGPEDIEELLLKSEMYIGSFEEWMGENNTSREQLQREAETQDMTYDEYLKEKVINHETSWLKVEYIAYTIGINNKEPEELKDMFMKELRIRRRF